MDPAYFTVVPLGLHTRECVFCGENFELPYDDIQLLILAPDDTRASSLWSSFMFDPIISLRYDGKGVHPLASVRPAMAHKICVEKDHMAMIRLLTKAITTPVQIPEYTRRVHSNAYIRMLAVTYSANLQSLTVLYNEPWKALTIEESEHANRTIGNSSTQIYAPPSYVLALVVKGNKVEDLQWHSTWALPSFVSRIVRIDFAQLNNARIDTMQLHTIIRKVTEEHCPSITATWLCALPRGDNANNRCVIVIMQTIQQIHTSPRNLLHIATGDWIADERKWALFDEHLTRLKSIIMDTFESNVPQFQRITETPISTVTCRFSSPIGEMKIYINSSPATSDPDITGLFNNVPYVVSGPTIAVPVIARGNEMATTAHDASRQWQVQELATTLPIL